MITEIKRYEEVDSEHLDSVWYGGDIVSMLVNNRYLVTLSANGDVRVIIKGKTYSDQANMGYMAQCLRENGITNDTELQKAIENEDLIFVDNNWVEIFIYDKYNEDYLYLEDPIVGLKENDDFSWVEDYINNLLED